MLLKDIQIPSAWAALGDRVVAGASPVLLLGAVDTGKSTLARYLLGRLIRKHGAAALLDGDVGMATVGIPGIVGLTLVRDVDQLADRAAVDRGWFVGSTTPAGNLLPTIIGHARLASLVRAEKMPCVINGSGLVHGSIGKALQLGVIDAAEPALVVGVARGGEIDHILAPLERRGAPLLRLEPSPRARPKPRSERTQLRCERFARYFESAISIDVKLDDYAIEGALLGSGRPLEEEETSRIEKLLYAHVIEGEAAGGSYAVVLDSAPEEVSPEQIAGALGGKSIHYIEAFQTTGLLVGLLAADGECLGAALLENWKGGRSLTLRTPLTESMSAQVRRLRLGAIRVTWTGDELGFAPRERELAPPEA